MGGPKWLDGREERAWRTFQVMQVRLVAELARDLSAHSALSYQDYVVLVALTDQSDGSIRVLELAYQLGWEKSRLSHQVTRMEKRGLVAKLKCPSDRRGATVIVTTHGRSEIEAAAPSHLVAVRRMFIDLLSDCQLGTVTAVAEAVLAAIGSDGR